MKVGYWMLHTDVGDLYGHAACYQLRGGSGRPQGSLPSSWSFPLFPLTSWEGQESLPGTDRPHGPLLDGGGPVGFGLRWTLKQHHTEKHHRGIQSCESDCVAKPTWTGRSQRWLGKKKTRRWGQLLGKWNLHPKFSLTVVHKAACMCRSSLERTEIMTLSDIAVKTACLAHSPVIS